MTEYKKYLGDLIGGSLMIKESQLIAGLLLTQPSKEQWDDAIVNQNILQKRSPASAKRNAATIKKRIGSLSSEFLSALANANHEEAAQLLMAATLINSPLLADFMRTVVMDAKRMYRESIDNKDWEYFWEDKCRLYPEFAEMSESSTYKIAQVAFKVMTDGGFLESTKSKVLTNIYIEPDVRSLLIEMDQEDIIQAMEAY
ncbi:DUF1819 domain-containing protein [Photobacterium damselae]|uniref:DUF1819 domain-containing protein n=1 Tax=Photobacterium damselae TaxID=38293 RepID=A0ACD3T279_PHODM|nr:DUF1819 family protein [Photobacterium damselae]RDL29036.1 hypothetical protein BC461_01545 [Photobacterium damselae]TMX48991.1 DUF1819 domain-containing protein [Photobacterium damselae]TMX70462.1 DUF1819 domain-containing protein [Photobacterium damselae]TMX78980.1 DUF1819 domain-containing protein [Photobacterium damselae]